MAINPIPQYLRKSYQDFSGGLNDFNSALIVPQKQFVQLDNALVNSTGILEKAPGYSVDGSPFPDDVDSFIRMLVNYRRGTSVDKLVCAALDEGNTNVTYQVDLKETSGDGNYAYIGHTTGTASFTSGNTAVVGVGTAWTSHLKAGDKIKATAHADAAYTEIASVTNDTNLVLVGGGYLGATSAGAAYMARKIMNKDFIPSSIIFNNNLVITNGSDRPMTYNNTTLNDITDADAPRGKFIVAHKSRVFIAGTSGGPSSIFWSAINDETSWDATSFEIVFANDNGNICGIVSFADSLIVLKDNGNIYQVVGSFDQDAYGEPDFIRKIDTPLNMGAIAGFTAAVGTDGKLNFLTQTGVYTLDARMRVEKISWDITRTTEDIVLDAGIVSSKSVVYDTTAQWDSGSYGSPVGMRGTSNKLSNINDLYTITDATKASNLCGIVVASNGDIHYMYVGTNGKTIKYVINTIAGVSTSEDVVTATGNITDLSFDRNSTGDIILAYTSGDGYVRTIEKLVAGSWGSVETHASLLGSVATTCAVKYGSFVTSNVYLVSGNNNGGSFGGAGFDGHNRVSGVWDSSAVGTDTGAGVSFPEFTNPTRLDIVTKNADDAVLFSFMSSNTLYVLREASRTLGYYCVVTEYSVAATSNSYSKTHWVKNSTNQRIVTYSDGATIKARNIDASATTVLDASYGNHTGVYINAADAYSYMRFDSSGTETLVYANSTAIVNTTTAVYDVNSLYPGRGFSSNGTVYASIYFGANANELIVRRMAPVATWTGPEQSDSSITVWGTYVVTGQVSNGNTVLHEIALNTISPPTAYATITDGSLISTDATKVFSRNRITITMTSFVSSEIGAITMNYTGSGVGAILPAATIYENEYYLSHGLSGSTANTTVLLYDRGNAWMKLGYPVIFMARYKGLLYGGASSTGKVYKLLTNYSMNGLAYTLTATSKEDLLGSIELEKEVYKAYVIYKIQSSGTFDFSYRTNNYATSGGSSWVTTTIDQTKDGIAEIPGISGLMKSIQFKVESDELDVQLGIIGWVVVYGYANLR